MPYSELSLGLLEPEVERVLADCCRRGRLCLACMGAGPFVVVKSLAR